MKIEKIKIEHFRGILEAELEFDPQLNVFIGGNAAGKTTVLTAIAQNLNLFIRHFISWRIKQLEVSTEDINYKKTYLKVTNFIKTDFFEHQVLCSLNKGTIPEDVELEIKKEMQVFQQFRTTFFKKIEKGKKTIPIIKFYPANKGNFTIGNHSNNQTYKVSQLEAWSNIYQQDVSYSKFFKWFFDYETKELRLKRDKTDINAEIPELKYIREAVQKTFKILQNKDYFLKSDQIKRNGTNFLVPTLVLENKETGESEDLNSKSDGEKTIITLVADIAYNLSIAKDFSEGEDYLSSPGIVLIDEIEAHLHPNWQRKIIPLLIELFPNIQFFITTHSPQILASVESQHIFVCEDFKFSKINTKSKGLDSNTILKHIFNATERPEKYVNLIERFDQIIEKEGNIKKLEAIISKIKALDVQDKGQDIDLLVTELNLQLEAYKFDLAHETHS